MTATIEGRDDDYEKTPTKSYICDLIGDELPFWKWCFNMSTIRQGHNLWNLNSRVLQGEKGRVTPEIYSSVGIDMKRLPDGHEKFSTKMQPGSTRKQLRGNFVTCQSSTLTSCGERRPVSTNYEVPATAE